MDKRITLIHEDGHGHVDFPADEPMTPRQVRAARRALRRDFRKTMRAVRNAAPATVEATPRIALGLIPARAGHSPIARSTRAGRTTTARRVSGFRAARRSTAARGPDSDQPGEPADISRAASPGLTSEEVAA